MLPFDNVGAGEDNQYFSDGLADAFCLMADYGFTHPGEAMPRARKVALDWLERGFKRRDLSLSALFAHPAYDSLLGESRFDALLRQMRFVDD